MKYSTPVHLSPYLSDLTQTNFYLKREDLFPEGGGGNKARILFNTLQQAKVESATALVTAGGPHSNFNRALALMGKSRGLQVHIILYDNNPHITRDSMNKRICDKVGIHFSPCHPSEVAQKIDEKMKELRDAGEKPYFIYGGGKSAEGISAYAEMVDELISINHQTPDLIVTTLATATTFSGLALGVQRYSPKTQLLGISVARKNELSISLFHENLKNFFPSEYQFASFHSDKFRIIDEYTFGGYGKSDSSLTSFLKDTIANTGLILDDIYVGKALFGLVDHLQKNPNKKLKNVVFLLTGGVYNL